MNYILYRHKGKNKIEYFAGDIKRSALGYTPYVQEATLIKPDEYKEHSASIHQAEWQKKVYKV